jgi:hypothetical protein
MIGLVLADSFLVLVLQSHYSLVLGLTLQILVLLARLLRYLKFKEKNYIPI